MDTETKTEILADWPETVVALVKDEAASYARDLRGDWPDPSSLQERAVERLMKQIDARANDLEAEESWWGRYEAGELEAEARAAVEHYADRIGEVLA